MGKEYSNYEMVENEQGYPYTIYIHTKEKLEEDGYIDHEGHMVIPKLMEHWHKALEIDYIFNGNWTYMVNGEKQILNANEIQEVIFRDFLNIIQG